MAKELPKCVSCNKGVAVFATVCPNCGQKNPTISAKAKFISFCVFAIVVLVGFNTCSSFFDDAENEQSKARSPEHTLAIVNPEGYVNEAHVSVNRFRYLLESIAKKTGYTHERIADMTVKAQTLLHEDGKDVNLLQLMEAANNAIPKGENSVKYEEILVVLTIMLVQ